MGAFVARLARVGVLVWAASAGHAIAAETAPFTQQQAQNGEAVFSQQCAVCHGSHLQGGAGPALTGSKFQSSLEFSKLSAKQLFDFISQHMPKNNPGGLSQQQYLEVFAYILSQNGFQPGGTKLAPDKLDQITLLPLPASGSSGS